MRISSGDWYEALRRLQNYQQDWETLEGTSSDADYEALTEKLKKKYHVSALPEPLKHSVRQGLQNKHPPVEAIPVLSAAKKGEDNHPDFEDMTAALPFLEKARRLKINDFLEKGRYLHLKIDLIESLPILEKAVRKELREWRGKIQLLDGRREGKTKKMKYYPWYIYDQRHRSGLSLLQIARKLQKGRYPRGKRTPAYTDELWPPYKRVKRAYDRAVEIMQTVQKKSELPKVVPRQTPDNSRIKYS